MKYTYQLVSVPSGKVALCLVNEDEFAPIYQGSLKRCHELLSDIKSGRRNILGNMVLETVEMEIKEG